MRRFSFRETLLFPTFDTALIGSGASLGDDNHQSSLFFGFCHDIVHSGVQQYSFVALQHCHQWLLLVSIPFPEVAHAI